MGSFSIWHWIVVLIIVLVLFGRGRVADIMGEFGKGINSFKKGVNEEARPTPTPNPQIEPPAGEAPAATETTERSTTGETGNN